MISSSASCSLLPLLFPPLDQRVSQAVTRSLGEFSKKSNIIPTTYMTKLARKLIYSIFLNIIFSRKFLLPASESALICQCLEEWIKKRVSRLYYTNMLKIRGFALTVCLYFIMPPPLIHFCWKSFLIPCAGSCLTHGSWSL